MCRTEDSTSHHDVNESTGVREVNETYTFEEQQDGNSFGNLIRNDRPRNKKRMTTINIQPIVSCLSNYISYIDVQHFFSKLLLLLYLRSDVVGLINSLGLC